MPTGTVDAIPRDVEVVPHRNMGRWILAAALLLMLGWVAYAMGTNEHIKWDVVGHYLLNVNVLHGLLVTLELALISEVLALVFGLGLAFFRLSSNPVLKTFASSFVWLFRSTPILVLILLCGNIALFIPRIEVGIPGTDVTLLSENTNAVVPLFVSAVIALVLHDTAYNAEIIRAGYASVDKGQHEASQVVGLTWWNTQRHIVLPQALRVIVPAAANQFVTLLKATALVSTIGVTDLLTSAQDISANNLRTIELLLVATIWFLVVTSLASMGQRYLERRADHGRGRVLRRRGAEA